MYGRQAGPPHEQYDAKIVQLIAKRGDLVTVIPENVTTRGASEAHRDAEQI